MKKEYLKISDLHNDFLTKLDENECEEYLKQAKKQGLKNLCVSIYTSEFTDGINELKFYLNKFKNLNDKNILNLFLHIEDFGLVKYEKIGDILAYKPFSVGLCWNSANYICGGASVNKGFTKEGIKVVKKLEENNVLIDTAHMNFKSFKKFAKITQNKLYSSHTMFCFCNKHERNLNNKQIKLIIKTDGLIGLTFVPKFYNKQENVTAYDIAKNIYKYLVKFKSENNLAIGTDFFGTEKLPKNLTSYNDFKILKEELKKYKLNEKFLNKIFNLNFENFIKNVKK